MDLPSDLIDLLAEFDREKVEFLVIGGQALALHGHPRFTKDADLWLRDTPENLARAKTALRRFEVDPPPWTLTDARRVPRFSMIASRPSSALAPLDVFSIPARVFHAVYLLDELHSNLRLGELWIATPKPLKRETAGQLRQLERTAKALGGSCATKRLDVQPGRRR